MIGLLLALLCFGYLPMGNAQDLIDLEAITAFWESMPSHETFTSEDGVSIAYRRFIHPEPRATVVILAGRTESFLKYSELIYELYQQGYSVYQHDHRGQGLSGRLLEDPLKGHVVEFDDYVHDLRAFMRQVVEPESAAKPFLISHSMGGAVAIRYLAEHADDFAGAVLGSPMLAPNTGPAGTCMLASIIGTLCSDCATPAKNYPTLEERFAQNRLTHSEQRFRLKEELYIASPEIVLGPPTFGWVRQACAIRSVLLEDAARIKAPVLLLQAGGDRVVLNEPQNDFCARSNAHGNPVCEGSAPLIIPDAHHELYFETYVHRQPALSATFDFLERLIEGD